MLSRAVNIVVIKVVVTSCADLDYVCLQPHPWVLILALLSCPVMLVGQIASLVRHSCFNYWFHYLIRPFLIVI